MWRTYRITLSEYQWEHLNCELASYISFEATQRDPKGSLSLYRRVQIQIQIDTPPKGEKTV